MRQLSGLDTVFLNLETHACPMHVGGLSLLDVSNVPGGFSFQKVLLHIEQRLHLLPPFRRRLVTTPMGLDQPYWIEDPDFNLENHVRRRGLPGRGGHRELRDLVCDVMSIPLDRSRPLWEVYVVEGFKDGRVALITKIHHACIDGVTGAEMLSVLLDLSPEPAEIAPPEHPWEPDKEPSMLKLSWMTTKKTLLRPQEGVRLVRESFPLVVSAGKSLLDARKKAREQSKVAEDEPGKGKASLAAPRTRFNTQITSRRSYAYGTLALDDIKFVKSAFGCTVNDVVLNISAEALRRDLQDKGELPEGPLYSGVPVSVRTEEQKGAGGNRVTMVRTNLHTDIEDPVERLTAINQRMQQVKQAQKAVPANLLLDWVALPSPALMAQAARLYENFAIQDYYSPPFNVVISNVPGPPVNLYFAGALVTENHPISIPYHGLAFNITVMSYRNQMDYGLTAHRDTLPDIGFVAELMEEALEELKKRAKQQLKKAG